MTQYPDGLEQLRERVTTAVRVIDRLKSDYAEQSDAMNELLNKVPEHEGPSIFFDGDRDDLRRKVKGYINTIERFLQEDKKV